MEKDKAIFYYAGESTISRLIGGISVLIVIYLGISSILKLNLLGLIIGFGLLFIIFIYIHNKVILNVIFYDEYLIVKYLFKKEKILISSIIKVYKNQEGFIPAHIYVAKFKKDKKIKKITFHCEENEFKNVVSP